MRAQFVIVWFEECVAGDDYAVYLVFAMHSDFEIVSCKLVCVVAHMTLYCRRILFGNFRRGNVFLKGLGRIGIWNVCRGNAGCCRHQNGSNNGAFF